VIGTQRQPLTAKIVVSANDREEFGLLTLTVGRGGCSASLLRNEWVITAAHCLELKDSSGNTMPDPSRPGQNILQPMASITITADWGTVQRTTAVRVDTFRPLDIALIRVATPFKLRGSTSNYSRLIFQDGQFPYFGEPVGANLMVFGRGIHTFATGQGDSAVPSASDGEYRVGYAKPTRNEGDRYWYPSEGGTMIAGGDSGGPSFAWVLGGYALVGVHSSTHANYILGKEKTGWTWVSSTPEAADAPLAPIVPTLNSIMGPVPIRPDERSLEPPPSGFIGTFSRTPPNYQPIWLYAIRSNGDLLWFRRDSNSSAWQGPKKVGTGWTMFKDVIAAGGNHLYGLTHDGKLVWYQHDGFNDGTFRWPQPIEVGQGWNFTRIFSGGDGVVYAIRKDGKLFWARHTGFRTGAPSWIAAKEVGSGWNTMIDVFSTGKGAVYAVKPDGTLLLYQQKDFDNGAKNWYPARTIASFWNTFQQIIPVGDGVILAIQPDGKLFWYKHLGLVQPNRISRIREGWEGPIQIGAGWQDFAKVIALMPETTGPIVQ
jgi:hypothetical protein